MTDRYRLVRLTPADAGRIQALEDLVWFEVTPGLSAEQAIEGFDFDRGLGVEGPQEALAGAATDRPVPLVGLYAAFDMLLTVPAATGLTQVPMSGLSWVGVHPDHRRQGVLRQMMTDHLHGLHDGGEVAVAGLWAAEVPIYGRFGYGVATWNTLLELGRGTELGAPAHVVEEADAYRLHLVPAGTPEAAGLRHALHGASAPGLLGTVTRDEAFSRAVFRDLPKARGAKEPWQMLVATRDGEPRGYAVLRRRSEWDDRGVPKGELRVAELTAPDSPALLALMRRLLDFDLVSTVKVRGRSVDDPLVWWAGGPRSTSFAAADGLWLRLVDLDRALEARGYAAACDVVLEVADDLCPWNAGRWRLRVGEDGTARCERTDAAADLSATVPALGSAYLGGRSLASLARAGTVRGHTLGSVTALSRALRADVEPLAPVDF